MLINCIYWVLKATASSERWAFVLQSSAATWKTVVQRLNWLLCMHASLSIMCILTRQ